MSNLLADFATTLRRGSRVRVSGKRGFAEFTVMVAPTDGRKFLDMLAEYIGEAASITVIG